MPRTPTQTIVPADAARRLLLRGAGLLERPDRRATPAAVGRQIDRLGFVQVDTISVVDRAHDRILRTRFRDYRPATLARLLERDRRFFEHWTHDASIIPMAWYPQWKHRFERLDRTPARETWWAERIGPNPKRVIDHVLDRLDREGPLRSADFEHTVAPEDRPEGGQWWGWKPAKTALEYLWRTGRVAVSGRQNFQKRYDLTERVIPNHDDEAPDLEAHIDWACQEALERLGVATPSELAAFFASIKLPDARRWTRAAVADGRAIDVEVHACDGSAPRSAVAHPSWSKMASQAPAPPDGMRLLSPFDPAIRDRARMKRLFDFEYRFEAFTPAAKRVYGYYVLPILDGDRLVGRLDPKIHRDRGELEIKGIWWEPGVRPTRQRRAALDDALDEMAHALEATTITMPA